MVSQGKRTAVLKRGGRNDLHQQQTPSQDHPHYSPGDYHDPQVGDQMSRIDDNSPERKALIEAQSAENLMHMRVWYQHRAVMETRYALVERIDILQALPDPDVEIKRIIRDLIKALVTVDKQLGFN